MYANIKNRLFYVWKLPSFPLLFIMNFIFGLSMSFFAPFSSLFGIDEVGMSNIEFGFFMTIMSIGGVLFSTYIGKLSDRNVSRKKLLMFTSLAAIIGYASLAYLRNYYVLSFVAFFLLGMSAATVPQLWAYAREALKQTDVPENETPYVMNVFRAFFALAWTVGPALASWVLISLGFKGLFLFVALGNFIALVAIRLYLKNTVPSITGGKKTVVLRKFIFIPHIFANIVAVLLLTTSISMNMLNMPQFVTKVLGGTEMHVGMVFSVPPIFEVPFMIIVGILAIKWDNALLIRIGFLITFIYFSLMLLVTEPWHIYPLQIFSAAQVSIISGIAVTYFQNFIPDEPGTATTLYMNTTQIGSTVGYLLFGFFSQYISYSNVFIICMVLTGIALIVLVSAGREKRKNSESNNDIRMVKM